MFKWQDMIGGCFGSADKKFAGHPNDIERAIDLLKECNKNCIPLSELSKEIDTYLKNSLDFSSKDNSRQKEIQNHIDSELNKVKEKFEFWLD